MKKFTILILAGLLLPAFCFGVLEHIYERTPEGFNIYNPVNFTLSFATYEDTTCCYYCNGWGLGYYWNTNGYLTYSEIIDRGTLTHTFTENLDFHSYIAVTVFCYQDGIYKGNAGYIEGDHSYIIFKVGKAPLIPMPSKFLASTTAYIGETFGDIWTLIALVIGLPLSFWGIKKVIGLVKVQ